MASNDVKLQIHTARIPETKSGHKESKARNRKRSSFHERLLRNSCLACAVLLGVLALSNVERPWAQKASDSIEKALTMKIDLDQSIGQMSFVQRIMPESALVFFNIAPESELFAPVKGSLIHAYSAAQPYLMFECSNQEEVKVCADGIVSALSQLSDGGWGALIDHGNGRECVISGIAEKSIETGQTLMRGDVIGTCSSRLYFEMREGGKPIDPTEMLGL